jgi:hypothetical protein
VLPELGCLATYIPCKVVNNSSYNLGLIMLSSLVIMGSGKYLWSHVDAVTCPEKFSCFSGILRILQGLHPLWVTVWTRHDLLIIQL